MRSGTTHRGDQPSADYMCVRPWLNSTRLSHRCEREKKLVRKADDAYKKD